MPEPMPISPALPKATSKSGKSSKGLSRADSWSVLALLVGVLFVIVLPPLPLKALLLVGVCIGIFLFCIYSHWTHRWLRSRQLAAASAVTVLLLAIGIPQFISQWRAEHPQQPTVAQSVTHAPATLIPPSSEEQSRRHEDTPAPTPPRALPDVRQPKHTTTEQRDAIRHDLETKWLALHPDAPEMVKQHKEWTKEEINWVNGQLKQQGEDFLIAALHRQLSAVFGADHDSSIVIDNAVITGNFDRLAFVDHGSKVTVGKGAVINKTEGPPTPK